MVTVTRKLPDASAVVVPSDTGALWNSRPSGALGAKPPPLKTFFSPGCTVELPSTEPAAVLVGAVVDDVLVEDDDDDVEDEEPGVELDVVVDGAVVLVDVDVEVLDEDVVVAPDVVVVWLNAGRARPATAAVTPAAAISRRRWRRLNP